MMNKKLILISALLFSFNGWAETYVCETKEFLKNTKNFTFSRLETPSWEEPVHFVYESKDTAAMVYKIVDEYDSHIHLAYTYPESAYYMIIGKEDNSFEGTVLGSNIVPRKPVEGSCYKNIFAK